MRSYWCRPDGTIETDVPSKRLKHALAEEQGLLWVDIDDPQDEEIELLLEVFEIHPLTIEDCILPSVRSKVEEFDRYLFAVLQGLSRAEDGRVRSIELDLCLGKNFLITVHGERIKSIDETRARVERKSPIISRGADFLFYVIADALFDTYFPILDEVESRVDTLETKLIDDSTERTLRELMRVYSEVMLVRRTLAPHRELFSRLNRSDVPFIRPQNAVYFRDIYDHILRMSDLMDACREVATVTLEAHATIVSNRLNDMMKTMTAFATLALPLIIVTGVYGMNFGEHPELQMVPRGFFHLFSLALVVSVPAMWWYFKRHRWL